MRPIDHAWVAEHLPNRDRRAHKGTFGRLLIVAGSLELGGAAVLAALGAARSGVGLVCIAAAASVSQRLAGVLPEAIWMLLDEEAPGLVAPSGWRRLATESARYDAVVIGPGLGRQPATLRRTRGLIGELRVPTVVDADGLTALGEGRGWWRGLRSPLVLTPHPLEFSRLSGAEPPPDDDDAREAAARNAATSWGQVVVLKGANTVVAAPDEEPMRSDVATPALATAGSGDVLSGAIGAFLAGGVAPFPAAVCGVAVHGAAGTMAETRIGRSGVIARDVASLLPQAIEQIRGDRRA
jgi:hydroxyethylthiazole kinase-like uncharacterized protein yjeF